jgi:hypothetical protein
MTGKLKRWVIRKLGGVPMADLPREVADRLEDEGVVAAPPAGKVEFVGEPTAEDESDALEEINRPEWKRFFDRFKIKR